MGTEMSKLVLPEKSEVLDQGKMMNVEGGAGIWETWLKAQIDKWLKR